MATPISAQVGDNGISGAVPPTQSSPNRLARLVVSR